MSFRRWNYFSSCLHEAYLQKIGQDMGISKHAVKECVMQVVPFSRFKMQTKVIRWSDDEELKRISARISKAHGL